MVGAIEISCKLNKPKKKNLEKLVEEKNAPIAPLSNHLQDCDKHIQSIQYENLGLQGKIHTEDQLIERCENTNDHLREGYVDHGKKPGLGNVVILLRKLTSKHNKKIFNYIAHIQRCAITTKRRRYKKHSQEVRKLW